MKRSIQTTLALVLAITMVAPSVYLGLLPAQDARAQTDTQVTSYSATQVRTAEQDAALYGGSGSTNTSVWTGFSGSSGPSTGGSSGGSAGGSSGGATGGVAGAVAGGAASMVTCTLMGLLSGVLAGMAATFTLEILGGAAVFGIGLANPLTVPSSEANVGKTLTDATQAGTGVVSAGANTALLFKECIIDPLLWTLKEVVIKMITQDIINWINNGFKGSPMFLTNPTQFFNSVLERTTSVFLFQSGLNNLLCSPFKVNLLFNLARDMYRNNRLRGLSCSLDQIFSQGINVSFGSGAPNVNSFFNGNFNQPGAGFPAFFKTLQQNNNPYGAYFEAESEAARLARQAAGHESRLLNQAQGYFSMRCDFDGDGKAETVCTPGSLVSHTVNKYTNNALDRLTIADEIGEIVNALVAALIKKIFENTSGGLLNFGSNNNTGSYWGDVDSTFMDRSYSNIVPPSYQGSFSNILNNGFNSFSNSASVLGSNTSTSSNLASSSINSFTQVANDRQDLLDDIDAALQDPFLPLSTRADLNHLENLVTSINIYDPSAASTVSNARDRLDDILNKASTVINGGILP